MRHYLTRAAIVFAVALGFLLILISVAFRWPASQGIILTVGALFTLGVAGGAVRKLRWRARGSHGLSSEPSASDDYSDLELGRRPRTFPPRDEASSSQIGDPPAHGGP